jgi:hypothetical protein
VGVVPWVDAGVVEGVVVDGVVEYEVAPKPFLDLVSDDRVGMVLALVCGGGGVCPFVVFILALFESRVVLPSGHALGSSSTARRSAPGAGQSHLPLPLIWHNDPLFTIALQPHP